MNQRSRLIPLLLLAAACTRGGEVARADAAPLARTNAATVANADSVARARQDSINRAQPGYVVDSALTPEEALRRFTATLPARPASLANGAASRDALVRKWVTALEANDSLTVIRLAVNRPEFGWLVFPSSPMMRPPTQQPPDVAWMLLSNGSVQGFRRAMNRLGGRPFGFVSYRCTEPAELQGENRIWSDCTVRHLRSPGDTATQRLFGSIIERAGHFKFLSLASDQ